MHFGCFPMVKSVFKGDSLSLCQHCFLCMYCSVCDKVAVTLISCLFEIVPWALEIQWCK